MANQAVLKLNEEVKTCSSCGLQKPINEYRIVHDKRDASDYRYPKCRACVSLYNRDYKEGKLHPRLQRTRPGERLCVDCGEWKPLTEFWKGQTYCKPCQTKRHKEWELTKDARQYKRKYMREYMERRRAEGRGNYSDNLADKILEIYGKSCACCGEAQKLFLTADHINNDGAAQRRALGKSGFRRWLAKQPKRDDIQTLCFNCNSGRQRNGGVCPHKALGE